MNLPGYDAWKLASPDDMTAEEEARLIAERYDAREQFREAIEGTIADVRGELYLSEVHDIVGEVLAKQKRHPSEPEHQVKMLNPIKAAPQMLEALQAHDRYMLDAGYSGPEDSALHPKAAENWRHVRAAVAAATTKGE